MKSNGRLNHLDMKKTHELSLSYWDESTLDTSSILTILPSMNPPSIICSIDAPQMNRRRSKCFSFFLTWTGHKFGLKPPGYYQLAVWSLEIGHICKTITNICRQHPFFHKLTFRKRLHPKNDALEDPAVSYILWGGCKQVSAFATTSNELPHHRAGQTIRFHQDFREIARDFSPTCYRNWNLWSVHRYKREIPGLGSPLHAAGNFCNHTICCTLEASWVDGTRWRYRLGPN